MARTALTTVTTAGFGEGVADIGLESVDQPNGNSLTNTGREIVIIDNQNAGSIVCTVSASASDATYNAALSKTLTVATTKKAILGPFATKVHGNTVNLDWDIGASVTVAVVDLTPVPA
jgi:hypothetical protein